MYYSQGTISTVSGSAIVRGTDTKFKSNINGVAPGQVILIQSSAGNFIHMIQAVNSDTELVLADNATATLNNVTYQIQTTVPDSVSDGVRHIVANTSYITQFLQNMDKWMSQNGVVDVTLPNGQTVALQSIRALQAAMLDKNKNGADIPNKSEFVKNLGLSDTVELAKNALSKSANGADIPDKAEFVRNIGLGSAAKKPVVSDPLFNSDQPVALQSFADFRRIVSWAIPGNYPLGISAGIAAGEQVKKPQYNYVSLLNIRGWPDDSGVTACSRWFITPDGNAGISYTHHYAQDDAHYYVNVDLWGTRNTTVDNNGYIKKASPIIQLHPDGSFTTNDESEGATVTKLGIGHYQVTGVLGYNADGAWGVHGGISSPKNNNGLELIYIDDKVQKDGSITIKTFHRQHTHLPERFQNWRIKEIVDGEKVYYADAEPCDIPEGCRLDVRVQMPADSIWDQKQHSQQEQENPAE